MKQIVTRSFGVRPRLCHAKLTLCLLDLEWHRISCRSSVIAVFSPDRAGAASSCNRAYCKAGGAEMCLCYLSTTAIYRRQSPTAEWLVGEYGSDDDAEEVPVRLINYWTSGVLSDGN